MAKTAGGVARRSLVRANSNTIPEENVNGACSGKKHHPVARVMYMIEYEPTTMSVRCSGAEIWLIHGFSRNMEFGFFDSYSLWDDI